jgi:hypothetical protein
MSDDAPVIADAPSAGASGTPAPETPWHISVLAPDKPGELIPDWHLKAPEADRGRYESYKGAKTWLEVADMADSRVKAAQTELRNRAAADKGLPVRPEGDAATPEAWKAYREAHGLPVDPKEYGLAKPADLPDVLWNQAETDEFAAFALENDLKPAQVKALAEWYQKRGMLAYGMHQQNLVAQKAAEDKARADYVQSQKETLVQNHGVKLDSELKAIAKIAAISGMDPERLNPDNPDAFIGADTVKVLASMYAMLPKSGDPTARMLGNNQAAAPKDRAYWANVIKDRDHPDTKALANPKDPRHATVQAERDLAYELHVQQQEKR